MSDGIVIALITSCVPTIATLITAFLQRRISVRNAAKSDILQMIGEDKIGALYGELPSNYQNIATAYDVYHDHGGDTYITEKVTDYKQWYVEQSKKFNARRK